jgi:hypothetical protein
MKNLSVLKQYFIDRDLMCKLFDEYVPSLLDIMADESDSIQTDNYKIFRNADEFYIIHLDSGTMINWYKHLGRTNTCNKELSMAEYRVFLLRLYDDLKKEGYYR